MKTHNPATQILKDRADVPCIPRASSDPRMTRLPHITALLKPSSPLAFMPKPLTSGGLLDMAQKPSAASAEYLPSLWPGNCIFLQQSQPGAAPPTEPEPPGIGFKVGFNMTTG